MRSPWTPHPTDPPGPFDRTGLHSVGREPMHSVRREPTVSLDGVWDFALLASEDADVAAAEWQSVEVPSLWTMTSEDDRAMYTNVPMPFDEMYPTIPERNPVGVYRRTIVLAPTDAGQRVILSLGAVEGYARIAVNSHPAGTSSDSHLAAEFDVTDLLVDGVNEFEIRVSKWSSATYLEDQDQWWHSGISRSISLIEVPATRIADVSLVADYDAVSSTASLRAQVSTHGLTDFGASEHRIRLCLGEHESIATVAARRPATTMPPPARDRSVRPSRRFPDDFMDQLSITAADILPDTAGRSGGAATPPPAGTAALELDQLDLAPWSAELPELHEVRIELVSPDDLVIDTAVFRVGFRRVEIRGSDLLVNGRRIMIQGVNRHDVDPNTGRVMSPARLRDELSMMKRFNINAVRASHYPNDPVLLDLCDELGLYVVDEADIEGHAFAESIADDPVYLAEMVTRVARMVLRDRNHPSIIAWSLGNETGYGAAHDAAAAWVRRFEPTRPVHYEGAVSGDWQAGHAASDIACPMYPAFASIEAYSASPSSDRPLIFSEYAYSQGNSTGGIARYWQLFENLPKVQGGFIWEFMDHALDPDRSGR